MTVEQAWNFILVGLTILAGGLSLYLKTKSGLLEKVGEYIAKAEELYKDSTQSGGQKFAWVVNSLYAFVPMPLRLVLTRELIGKLVQQTFDTVERYAVHQLNKEIDKLTSGQGASKP